MPRSLATTLAVVTVVGLAPAACSSPTGVPTDFEFVSTSLGLRNSGLLQPGQLYLLDLSTNTLVDLQELVPLSAPPSLEPPQTRVATNVTGVSFGGSATAAPISAAARAEFERSLSFRVEDAQRVNHSGIITAVSSAYATDPDGNFDRWQIERLVGSPGRFKLVLLLDPTFARREEIQFTQAASLSGSGRVQTVEIGDTSFSVDKASTASCEAVADARTACFIAASVLEASLVPRRGERIVRFTLGSVGRDVLPAAFRGLG